MFFSLLQMQIKLGLLHLLNLSCLSTAILLGFHAYINEMHGSRSRFPSKKSRQTALRGGI
jgi:hypothetical protein